MGFEKVFSGSKVDPGFYDIYSVETILDPNPIPESEEELLNLKGMVATVKHNLPSTDNKLYVMKSINKKVMVRERVQRECEINMKIMHPNITRVREIFESEDEVFLIMDHMGGGDLFDRVAAATNCALPETEVHQYMQQLMSVVVYLHDMGIAHRDLKPENIMFETKDINSKLCVLDFGFAKRTEETLETPIGTVQYLAPEVLQSDSYDKSVDIWSVGCILYFMLFGKTPFLAPSEEDTVAKAAVVEFHFPETVVVSDASKDLISKLLRKDPAERLTANGIVNHKWMVNGPSESPLNTSAELAGSNPDSLLELRASINLAIDHAREEAEELSLAAQKSPRGNAAPPPILLSTKDSPAYKKRTGVGKRKVTEECVQEL